MPLFNLPWTETYFKICLYSSLAWGVNFIQILRLFETYFKACIDLNFLQSLLNSLQCLAVLCHQTIVTISLSPS